jgi:3-hydroxybutyryl-CoA dehydratase
MINKPLDISDLRVGMIESYTQIICDKDINSFAEISGDRNPVHLDDEYAKNTIFKKRIAHGFMSASFFSALFGTRLPGEGCVYVSQQLFFKKPIYIGDQVTAYIELIDINVKKRRAFFDTYCKVNGRIVIDGKAEIYIPPKD